MNDEAGYFPFSINVSDKFGDFGLINVVVLRGLQDVLEIDSFLMSCRVLKRGVEQFAMNKIFQYARAGNFKKVIGRYIPSAKNVMVQRFYEEFSFSRVEGDAGEGTLWSLDVDSYVPREVFIRELTTTA
jgi:FkbH-like protein